MLKLIRTTLIGGVVFLIPLVFFVVIIGKAFHILKVVATPLGRLVTPDSVAGVAVVEVLTVAIMLLLCLIAGLLARSQWARNLYGKLDAVLLQVIPGYAWIRHVTGGIRDEDAEGLLKPVLVRFDDQSQVGFEVERTDTGLVAVYLPGAPDVRSGAVSYVQADRIEPVDAEFDVVVKSLRHLGRGSGVMLARPE
jgi:uncharacterized membrane protein